MDRHRISVLPRKMSAHTFADPSVNPCGWICARILWCKRRCWWRKCFWDVPLFQQKHYETWPSMRKWRTCQSVNQNLLIDRIADCSGSSYSDKGVFLFSMNFRLPEWTVESCPCEFGILFEHFFRPIRDWFKVAMLCAVLIPFFSTEILGLDGLHIGWWGWIFSLVGAWCQLWEVDLMVTVEQCGSFMKIMKIVSWTLNHQVL